MNQKGKLIVFEGIDGCGKTTQIKLVNDYLIANGYDIVLTKEPGGTAIGEKIRELLLDKDNEIDTVTEAYLFAASRAAHNEQIVKWIKEGKIVLCDRHIMSSLVYQGPCVADKVNKMAMEILTLNEVDINFLYFDISNETYKKRVNIRKSNRELDRVENLLEKSDIDRYLYLYKMETDLLSAKTINANKSINDIQKEVLKVIKDILK